MTVSMPTLLARRAKLQAELRAADAAASEDGGDGTMTEAQQAAFDTLRQALAALEAAIQNRAAIDALDRETRGTPIGGGDRQWQDRKRSFRLCNALAGACGLPVDDGNEREVSRELAKRSGRAVEGIMIPLEALHRPIERRVLTPSGPGTGLVGDYLDGSLYVDALRAQIVVARLGARYLTGLDTNIDLPRLAATATAQWVADGAAITTDTTEAFDKISLRPHTVGGIVEFTRGQLLTSTPAVQEAVRDDLVKVLARAMDAAALAGTGGVMPTGILNAPGLAVYAMGANGGDITWAAVLNLILLVQAANAPIENQAFVGAPIVRAAGLGTLKFAAFGSETIMSVNDQLAGYPFAATTLCPSNGTKGTGTNLCSLIFGSWSDVIIGMWGGEGGAVECLVNPYGSPQFSQGNVQVRALMNADVQLAHTASFAAITDLALL